MATHTLTIADWHPTRLNELVGSHWAVAARLKAQDKALVAHYAHDQGVPRATGKRRVGLTIHLRPKQRAGDPDAYWKSLLDALTAAELLIDDNRQHVELSPVEYVRPRKKGRRKGPAANETPFSGSVITLEDMP